MKSLAYAILALGISTNVHAAFIDSSTFLTDTDSSLDWLDVTATYGRSYTDVFADINDSATQTTDAFSLSDGWRYATGDEFNALVSNWIGTTTPITTYSTVTYFNNEIDGLVTALGSTIDMWYQINTGGTYEEKFGYAPDSINITAGLLDDEYIIPGRRYQAAIFDDDRGLTASADTSTAHYTQYGENEVNLDYGSFLVRDTNYKASTSVPETSSIALLGLGLIALGMRRKHSK